MVEPLDVRSRDETKISTEVDSEYDYWPVFADDGTIQFDLDAYVEYFYDRLDETGRLHEELFDEAATNLSLFTAPFIDSVIKRGEPEMVLLAIQRVPTILETALAMPEDQRRTVMPDEHLDSLRDNWRQCFDFWAKDVRDTANNALGDTERMTQLDPYQRIGRVAAKPIVRIKITEPAVLSAA
jgi:hypothetical protein